jgi:hypothetical protein
MPFCQNPNVTIPFQKHFTLDRGRREARSICGGLPLSCPFLLPPPSSAGSEGSPALLPVRGPRSHQRPPRSVRPPPSSSRPSRPAHRLILYRRPDRQGRRSLCARPRWSSQGARLHLPDLPCEHRRRLHSTNMLTWSDEKGKTAACCPAELPPQGNGSHLRLGLTGNDRKGFTLRPLAITPGRNQSSRGAGRPALPLTPPDVRCRIRRFRFL